MDSVQNDGMATTINTHEAKTQLSRLLTRVEAGEEIVIAKAGRPAARLVPIQSTQRKRKPGALKGKIHVAEDFDAPLPDTLLAAFEGR